MAFEQILLIVILIIIVFFLNKKIKKKDKSNQKFTNKRDDVYKPTSTGVGTRITTPIPPKPIVSPDYNYNITNIHEKDKNLTFIEDEHLYFYETFPLIAVSTLIEAFFPKFESEYWAERKAIERKLEDPQQILDEWGFTGAEARELGTYLHQQIEKHYQNKPIDTSYIFTYKSEYVNDRKNLNIDREFFHFKGFRQINKSIIPYRTSWSVYDEKSMVAGSIDLISKQKYNFALFDWKRSRKLGWEINGSFVVNNDNYNKYGFHGLEHIPDTTFNRYSLQQNIYKYIIEKNYGLKIDNMYLVILHPNYSKAHLVEVPNMQKEAEYMLQNKHLVLQK